jgi:hypothetical protein
VKDLRLDCFFLSFLFFSFLIMILGRSGRKDIPCHYLGSANYWLWWASCARPAGSVGQLVPDRHDIGACPSIVGLNSSFVVLISSFALIISHHLAQG